jgi:hypothetical protein
MKYTLLLIMCLYGLTLSGQVMHGKVDYTKTLKFNNNYFKFSRPISMAIQGKVRTSTPTPIEVNGDKIYESGLQTDKIPKFLGTTTFPQFIRNSIRSYLKELPDGKYAMETFNLVIDDEGKLIYFDFREITKLTGKIHVVGGENVSQYEMSQQLSQIKKSGRDVADDLPSPVKKRMTKAMYNVLAKAPKFTPATVAGKKVNCLLSDDFNFKDFIVVKNHVVSFESWGE